MPQAHELSHAEYADAAAMTLFGEDLLLVSDGAGALHLVDLEKFEFVHSMKVPSPQGAREGFYPVPVGIAVDFAKNIVYAAVSGGGASSVIAVKVHGLRMNITANLEVGESALDNMFMISSSTIFAIETQA